jgi:hypothetical protein
MNFKFDRFKNVFLQNNLLYDNVNVELRRDTTSGVPFLVIFRSVLYIGGTVWF